jgi:hypothetical protein
MAEKFGFWVAFPSFLQQGKNHTYDLVKEVFDCEYRGKFPIKNMDSIDMYFANQIKPQYAVDGEGLEPNEAFWQAAE